MQISCYLPQVKFEASRTSKAKWLAAQIVYPAHIKTDTLEG